MSKTGIAKKILIFSFGLLILISPPLLLPEEKNQSHKDAFMEFLGQMPTFMGKFQRGTYEAFYFPQNIIVLTSARTYSSGFSLAALLYKNQATIVGVPSAQAGNCFSDTIGFELSHTGIKGYLLFFLPSKFCRS